MTYIFLEFCANILRKTISLVKHPRIPWILQGPLKTKFPRLYCLLNYRTLDTTSKRYWDGVWREEGLSTWRTYPNLFEMVTKEVKHGSKILDLGCGPGILLRKLRAERECACFGLDISLEAIKLLKETFIDGVVARFPGIPFKNSSFDTVTATEVLEHIENPAETLKEMKRVTKTCGSLICSVPNACMTKEECNEHLHNFTSESFTDLIKAFGDFTIITVDDMGGARLLAIITLTSK